MTSDAFLLQNNAFKHIVCSALLWKKILWTMRYYSKLANSLTNYKLVNKQQNLIIFLDQRYK